MFALFTYPFSILIILIQIVFVHVRPLTNPEKLPRWKWFKLTLLCITWLGLVGGVLILLLFGTTIEMAIKSDNFIYFMT